MKITYKYALRVLDEQSNENVECTFAKEKKLAKYNCQLSFKRKINIENITISFNFIFSSAAELIISPIALFNKDKLQNQTGNNILTDELIILYGNLKQEDDYFKVKGKLDKNGQIDSNFFLTVYTNNSNLINISCETINEIYNNFEIQREKDKSNSFNLNNSISYMKSKQLLVSIDDGENDFITQKESKIINNFLFKKN